MKDRQRASCIRCSAPSTPARGPYLELLYPLERFCDECGRRERFCSCLVAITTARPMPALREAA